MAPGGVAEFGGFGIDVDRLEQRTRPLLRPCLDWSELRYHLAGSLGAALTSSLLTRGWITTREASRIVTVTKAGQTGLREWLGIDVAGLRSAASVSSAVGVHDYHEDFCPRFGGTGLRDH